MKKVWVWLLGLALLCGCAANEAAGYSPEEIKTRLAADCTFTAEFSYEKTEGRATVEKTGEQLCITMTEPETLEGLAFILGLDSSQMIYGDTVIDLQDHTIRQEALAALLKRALAGADELTVTQQNGRIQATADCTFFHYTVELEEDTGYPTGISVPELQIEIVITDYTPAGSV